MADERCVYENVLRDASSLCVDIFVKLLAILIETSDHSNLPSERIVITVAQLFHWIAYRGELHVLHAADLKGDIARAIKNRACEHGFRYKALVEIDAFWDEKRLRTLKDARRVTQHYHFPLEGIAPPIDKAKTELKKEVKEQRE